MTGERVGVVVAGAGAAGCAAALAAAEGGHDVALVEAHTHFRHGCNTAMSTSMIPAAGSRWQAAAGIDDSPQRFHDDVMRKTAGAADPALATALTEVAPDLVAWLADSCGVDLQLVTDFAYPGHSRHRCHAVADRSGATLHAALLTAVDRHDAITLAVPVRLDGVVLDDGAVTAARLATPEGDSDEVATGAVVLATNGFGADPELVRRYLPEIARGRYHGGDGSTGDALRIGADVGADIGYLDAYQGHGSLAVPHGIILTWAAIMHGGFLLNASGERFGDETVGYSEFGTVVLDQPDGVAWSVFDRRIDAALRPFADYQACLEAGAVQWADDVASLARLVAAPVEAVAATVAAAEAAAADGRGDVFGRSDWEVPLAPPYAAVKVTGALFHTQGGLKVDGDARVLRRGSPIPGLYAAGGAANGISGHGAGGYLAGNGLLSALGLGLLAGRAIGAAA